MSNSNMRVMCLKVMFIVLGCFMVATLLYTITTDGSPFRKQLITPWLTATLVDFYINVIVLAAWINYKESSWLAAVFWIVLLVCFGSVATCVYITIQLFKLSAEESSEDPMYHLLLRSQSKNAVVKRGSSLLVPARIFFSVLGCIMLGVLIYTLATDGWPSRKELLRPWMVATLIDFYINFAALSVWIGYKESSWFIAVVWIVFLIYFGRGWETNEWKFLIATCAYVVRQLFLLSPGDPLYVVLLNSGHRVESSYERA